MLLLNYGVQSVTTQIILRFLELNFLVVRREEAQVTECRCPDEVVKQELVALGWSEMAIWTREELGERMGDSPEVDG